MFMPPWYQPIIVQSKPTNKLPYQKFQYPIYVKDNNHDVNIRIFNKAIGTNDETMEVDIINLLVSLYEITSRGGPKTLYKITPIALLRN